MNDERREKLRRIARGQVYNTIEDDLKGGESMMKEAWEQCDGDEELAVMEDELRAILIGIKSVVRDGAIAAAREQLANNSPTAVHEDADNLARLLLQVCGEMP